MKLKKNESIMLINLSRLKKLVIDCLGCRGYLYDLSKK